MPAVLSTSMPETESRKYGHFIASYQVSDPITDFLNDASSLLAKDGGVLCDLEKAGLWNDHVKRIECTGCELDENFAWTGLWNLVLAQCKLGTDFWEPERCLCGHSMNMSLRLIMDGRGEAKSDARGKIDTYRLNPYVRSRTIIEMNRQTTTASHMCDVKIDAIGRGSDWRTVLWPHWRPPGS
jgi:hypothetical protein